MQIYTGKDLESESLNSFVKLNVVVDIGGGKPWKGRAYQICPKLVGKTIILDCDITQQPNILGDVQILPFKSESIDGVICNAVLEHVPNPFAAMNEIYRILRPGGKFIGYVPFLFPYHGNSQYKDYNRFTLDSIENLFSGFSNVLVAPSPGGYVEVSLSSIVYFRQPFRKILLIFAKPLKAAIHNLLKIIAFFKHKSPSEIGLWTDLDNNVTGFVIWAQK